MVFAGAIEDRCAHLLLERYNSGKYLLAWKTVRRVLIVNLSDHQAQQYNTAHFVFWTRLEKYLRNYSYLAFIKPCKAVGDISVRQYGFRPGRFKINLVKEVVDAHRLTKT